MKRLNILLMISLLSVVATAQEESSQVRKGNNDYHNNKFTEAEINYRKGLEKNNKSFEATYNLGNALFKQGKFQEALQEYGKALALPTADKQKIAAALHNAGNALLKDNKIQESIDAYKASLKANPKDDETRYNLAYAMNLLKNQQQNQDKNKDQDKKQDQNKKDQQQQQQQQDNQQQQQPPKPNEMTKEKAEQMLDALMQDEKNAMDKTKKVPVRQKRSSDKDW